MVKSEASRLIKFSVIVIHPYWLLFIILYSRLFSSLIYE